MILTPTQRLVCQLQAAGHSQTEIAKRLHVSQPAISKALARARNRIAELARDCGSGDACGLLSAALN